MIAGPRVGQILRQVNHCGGKLKQPFLEVKLTIPLFAFTEFTQVARCCNGGWMFDVECSMVAPFHFIPVPPPSAASVFAAHPGGRAHGPPPYPRLARWFWGLCRNTDWPAESSRRPAAAVRNSSRAPDSAAFRAAPGSVSCPLSA